MTRRSRAAVGASLLLTAALAAQTVTLIPVPTRRDHVHDDARKVLYISTSDGRIERYDTANRRLLAPLPAGTSLNGLDLRPDGAAIYATEATIVGREGAVLRVDLPGGKVTRLTYPLDFGEAGGFDIDISSNGRAMLTTMYAGSGWIPMRELDTSRDVLTKRTDLPFGGRVRQNTFVSRSADRGLLFFSESNISSGPIFTYRAASNMFSSKAETRTFVGRPTAVSRDGKLLALPLGRSVSILDQDFATLRTIDSPTGGVAFDPVRPWLYVTAGNAVDVHDTRTWKLVQSMPIGEDVGTSRAFGDAMLSTSADGSLLFVSTPGGVRMVDVGKPKPVPTAVAPVRRYYKAPAARVTITGDFFDLGSNTSVLFGNTPATDVDVVNATTITCRAPSGQPGPVTVTVRNDNGSGQLDRGFTYTPALLLEGRPAPGDAFLLRHLIPPDDDSVIGLIAAPPAVSVAVPPFEGELCLRQPVPLFVFPYYPLDELRVRLRVPNTPSLGGAELLFQALIGDSRMPRGTWTNCETLTIRTAR